MKLFGKSVLAILLLYPAMLWGLTACQDHPDTPHPDTTESGSVPDGTVPDETVSPVTDPTETDPAETDPAETDPAETDPLETTSVPSGIPDPTMSADFTPRDGVIASMGLFGGTEFGDTVGYASTIVAGGEFGSYQVTHKGETYTLPAYCKTAADGQAAALDLSAYADDPNLRTAIADGYTIELTVQLTEDPGEGFQALFSSTQNGMFGLAMRNGHFLFQQFNGTGYTDAISETEVRVGELYHLVGVYNAQHNDLRLYVNGEEQAVVKAGTFGFGESPFIYVIGADVGYSHVITDYPSPPAIFTKAALYDASMSASEVSVLYDTAVKELANPPVPTRPYHPASEYFFTTLELRKEPRAGEEIEIVATLENRSDTDRIFKLALCHPLLSAECDESNQSITVKAGSTAPVCFKVRLREGGSMLFVLNLLSENGLTVMSETLPVVASGKGYYVGDAHTHSTLSDGKDSLADNFGTAHSKGQAFMIATDHNYDVTLSEPITQAASLYSNFLAITANEVTTEYGHMLEYGVPHRHSGGYTGHMWEIMAAYRPDAAEWQRLFDEIISEGGICYIAHPFFFSNTGSWKWPGVGSDQTQVSVYKGFTGIEVYNSDSHANGIAFNGTEKAFEWWDRYNLKGEQRYYGISNTDGHTKDIVSRTGNALLLEELTPEAVLNALRNGHFYGTNGAEIRFDIDGVGMGDCLPLPADGKATLTLRVADQGAPLTKVLLYTYTMTGNIEEAYRARKVDTLFDSEKDGTAWLFELTREIEVQDGQFYRVEVYSASSLYGDYEVMGGFAFTNPIWVGDLIPALEEDDPTEPERKLTLNKAVFAEGEDIFITAVANVKTDLIGVYPASFVPGQDASIYWAYFEGGPHDSTVIPVGQAVKLTDMPGDNRGNWQTSSYYDVLPAGEYKVVLRGEDGSVVYQVNFTVVKPDDIPDPPDETRRLSLDKETYTVGEDIWITAGGIIATDAICVYPIHFTPGQDASIYWAQFEGRPNAVATVASGSTFKLTDMPGDNRSNWQTSGYYDVLPAGEYKVVLRGEDGCVVLQVNFAIVE